MVSRPSTTRASYQAAEGFLFFTDVSNQIANEAATVQPAPVEVRAYQHYNVQGHLKPEVRRMAEEPGITSAYFVMSSLQRLMPTRQGLSSASHNRYGITKEDMERARQFTVFQAGLGDFDFPWEFSLCVADNIVRQGVEEGKMSAKKYRDFTLRDWAGLLQSGWFSDVIHSMAFTGTGVYRSLGSSFEDYQTDSIRSWLVRDGILPEDVARPFIITAEAAAGSAGSVPLRAQLTKETTLALRKVIRQAGDTRGCPVARHAATLSPDLVRQDPHLRSLVERGTMQVYDKSSGTVVVRQEQTAIDELLQLLGNKFREYERVYGTPQLFIDVERAKIRGIAHAHRESAGGFTYDPQSVPVMLGGLAVEELPEESEITYSAV